MSNNLDNERSVPTGKMYPIDLAPQKITIVKTNSEIKMAHLVPGQAKVTGASQIITHTGPLSLMRPTTQIISSSVASQPPMIVSGSPMLQVTQIVSQSSQIMGQGPQIITQPQLINSSGQMVSPGTQIISQGTQLSAQVGNTGLPGTVLPVSSSGHQVLNVGGQLVGNTGNLVVSSTVRTLPPSVKVLPPLPHHNARPVSGLSNVSLSNNVAGMGPNMVVSKNITSHVPRGPAAGASLAVPRVAARPTAQTLPISSLGGPWSAAPRAPRGAVVYSARAPRAPPPRPSAAAVVPAPAHSPVPTVVTISSSSVLTSSGVIAGSVRSPAPRPPPVAAPRPLPLLQRNYQTAKVIGVANVVNVRPPVGNSAPSQVYYQPAAVSAIPVNATVSCVRPMEERAAISVAPALTAAPTVSVVVPPPAPQHLPRPSILRKRDLEGSPSKACTSGFSGSPELGDAADAETAELTQLAQLGQLGEAWDDDGGSTTVSAASSPEPDDNPPPAEHNISPRKKPRKQMLSNDVRQCEYAGEEAARSPPPAPALAPAPAPAPAPPVRPPPKRPTLSGSYVCGWRATALHFRRPADVRRRSPRPRDLAAIAAQRHVLASAGGWKVHYLTAQMDDLVSLESDVGEQLSNVLNTLEGSQGKAQSVLAPHAHNLLELVKGNIQRSRIVCEGIREAREDLLRVFTHRTFVSDILTRQADKRSFRKHRSQS